MIKKFFTFCGVLTLICFSFYYTDTAVDIVKRNDPIMKEIQSVSLEYYEDAIDAVLINDGIIPGISGRKINIDKSYEKMKKYGSFDAGLLIFEEVVPMVATSSNYDKFIISGNSNKQSVSLIFKLYNSNYLDDILKILRDKDVTATFFISNDVIYNDSNILEKITNDNHSIELLSDKYLSDTVNTTNKILKQITKKKINYCYTEEKNNNILSSCKKNKMHSIVPNIITTNFPYAEIKNNVTSGSMISLSNSLNTLRELVPIINYINQKGFKIVTIDELLNE